MKKLIVAVLLLSACQPLPPYPSMTHQAVASSDGGGGGPSSWVLDFVSADFVNAPQVTHGAYFYTPGATLGHFAIQAWVMPRCAGARYWLSEGYGGWHSILAGFTMTDCNHNYIYAGVNNSTSSWYCNGATAIQQGTWVHVSIDWDGSYIRCRLNGVLDGKVAFTGPRTVGSVANGGGGLFVGGSDHSNFDGRIAELELWEGSDPLYPSDASFYYRRRFLPYAVLSDLTVVPANLLAVYTTPVDVIPDLSPAGYGGLLHPGTTYAAASGGTDTGAFVPGTTGIIPLATQGKPPTWVLDNSAPTAQ